MSNSYKITAVDRIFTSVTFVIDGTTLNKKFDSRYLPISDAEALDEFFIRQLSGLVAGKEQESTDDEIDSEVKKMISKKRDVSEEDIARLEVIKAEEIRGK